MEKLKVSPAILVMLALLAASARLWDARPRPQNRPMFPTAFESRSTSQAIQMSPLVRIATKAS